MKLNIVCFQLPYPADYGGVIDVYYKIKALRQLGVGVRLHAYVYDGREVEPELSELCEAVYTYPRHHGLRYALSAKPYIVSTRHSAELLRRLLADDAPVLLEGLHCCGLLGALRKAGKRVIVRTHNVEHDYYAALSRRAGDWRKRLYYNAEAHKLRRYEGVLKKADAIMAISRDDADYFRSRYPDVPVLYLPPFYDDKSLMPEPSDEVDVLYHGNLSVEENIEAVRFIIHNIKPLTAKGLRYVIAGRRPSSALRREIEGSGAVLISNPTDLQLDTLIASAKVNLLITDQPTGMKLKLMKVLTTGLGYCLVNSKMLTDRDLRDFCMVADGADNLAAAVDRLTASPRPLTEAAAARERFLSSFGTRAGARTIAEQL